MLLDPAASDAELLLVSQGFAILLILLSARVYWGRLQSLGWTHWTGLVDWNGGLDQIFHSRLLRTVWTEGRWEDAVTDVKKKY